VRTVRVRYTNPGKPEGKRSPPKTTTRPIHKVAVVVPAEYVFEDDTCDNMTGSRCPKRDLKLKEETEAARAPRKKPAEAKREGPEKGGEKPAVRRRRGRPRKPGRSATTGEGPQAEEQGIAEVAMETGVLQETGDQTPAMRRGQARNLGSRGQQDRGRNC
jgi:hypothetical protein